MHTLIVGGSMSYSKLEPAFKNIEEIRMGSPYNVCDLELMGKWIPDLPAYEWQDLFANSQNNRYLALVAWAIKKNNPGFKLIIIDLKNKNIKETERITGCCKSIYWTVSGFSYDISGYISEKDFSNLRDLR